MAIHERIVWCKSGHGKLTIVSEIAAHWLPHIFVLEVNQANSPVGRGCRIPTASLHMGKTPPNGCTGYDTKQSDGEFPVMLDLWVMRSVPSMPLLPDPLWPSVVALHRVLSMS